MTESAQALFAQAQKLRFESGDPEGALKFYRAIISDYGDSPEADYATRQIQSMLAGPSEKKPAARSAFINKKIIETAHGGYTTSRQLFQIISFAGWLVAAVGVLAFIGGVTYIMRSGSVVGVLPGLGSVVFGLFIVATGQVSRAIVDMAEYSRDILAELRMQNS